MRRGPALVFGALAFLLAGTACDYALGLHDYETAPDQPSLGGAPNQPGASGASAVDECTTHADCVSAHFGEPYLCRTGRCLALKNDRPGNEDEPPGSCRVVLGQENLKAAGEPFVFGAMSLVDPLRPESSVHTLNYRLAIEEFTRKGGIRIAGESRLPVTVVCDSAYATPAELDRNFDHLVETLQVPAIVAAVQTLELKRSFERIHQQKRRDVFFLSPFDSDPLLLAVTDDGLLWHLLGNMLDTARAYVPLLQRVEAHVNPGGIEPIRVALVVADFAAVSDIGDFLHDNLVFNGRSARDNAPDHFLRVDVVAQRTDAQADHSAAMAKLREFRPHVVVSAAEDETTTVLIPQLEETWPLTEQPRPFYVLSPYQRDWRALALVQDRIGLRSRVAGVNVAAAPDPSLYDRYLSRLQARFPDAPPETLPGNENFYDAIYRLLFAVSAGATTSEPTGADVLRGMTRQLSGEVFGVEPESIAPALSYLELYPNRPMTLLGTMGPPDFDRATGGHSGTGSVWCIQEGNGSFEFVLDTLRYNHETRDLDGMFPCFAGL